MVGRSFALALLLAVAAPRTARADSAKLVEARAAITAVDYVRARSLLVEALQAGTSSPAEVAELYRLSASTATVLGDRATAEQYYRRWIALDPAATLPDAVAPKLREPFVAAQAYMAARGRLVVGAQRDADAISVRVDADPLAMVAAVALDAPARVAVPLDGDRQARLPGGGDAPARVVALDTFGNALVELEVQASPPAATAPASEVRDARVAPGSWLRSPVTWAAPAIAIGGLGVAFGLAARRADADLDAILAAPSGGYFDEAEDARERRDRHARFANVAFVVAGACAVTSVVMFAIRPRAAAAPVAVVPTASGAAISLTW